MNMTYHAIEYRDGFRKDQERILGRILQYTESGKLHMVAPPGSEKYVLGLELLRNVGKPALILSASSLLGRLWEERFVSDFLPPDLREERGSYFSRSMDTPALLTAITYETLAATFNRSGSRTVDEEGVPQADVVQYVHSCGIRTILLDDPHHIGRNCTGALESFFGVLGAEVKVISINSTLPYDLNAEDWNRFSAICGPVDVELRLSDYVRMGIVRPHQDYVYFNYPTQVESEGICGYRLRADMAVTAAMALPFAAQVNQRLMKLRHQRNDYLDTHRSELGALLRMMAESGFPMDKRLVKAIHGQISMPPLTLAVAEEALQFLLESQSILKKAERSELRALLEDYRVLDNGRVRLAMTGKVRRTFVSSLGKLDSIAEIIDMEKSFLGVRLRALVMTDALMSEELTIAGTGNPPLGIGMISVFETLRRRFTDLPIGCVSDQAVILPGELADMLARDLGQTIETEALGETGYAYYRFADPDMQESILQSLFVGGQLRVLIGDGDHLADVRNGAVANVLTIAARQACLADVNCLRGQVMAADPTDPDKVAHIWHLATVERPYDLKENPELRLASRMRPGEAGRGDLELEALRRYFICFIGPNETGPGLVSGIDRLGDIHDPRNCEELLAMNETTRGLAADRARLAEQWRVATALPTDSKGTRAGKQAGKQVYGKSHLISEVLVPKESRWPLFTPGYVLAAIIAIASIGGGIFALRWLIQLSIVAYYLYPYLLLYFIPAGIADVLVILWAVIFILYYLSLVVVHLSARNSIRVRCRALLKAMMALDLVDRQAVLVMQSTPDHKGYRVFIHNCNLSQRIGYQMALAEMMSAIENPRYLIVRSGWGRRLLWRWSCTCPSIIAQRDTWVKKSAKYFRRAMGGIKFHYTNRELGRKHLFFAINRSYLNTRYVHSRCRVREVWISVKKPKKKRGK